MYLIYPIEAEASDAAAELLEVCESLDQARELEEEFEGRTGCPFAAVDLNSVDPNTLVRLIALDLEGLTPARLGAIAEEAS